MNRCCQQALMMINSCDPNLEFLPDLDGISASSVYVIHY